MECINDCDACTSKCCDSCDFFKWYEDYKEYFCSIKGCWNHSKWKQFLVRKDCINDI